VEAGWAAGGEIVGCGVWMVVVVVWWRGVLSLLGHAVAAGSAVTTRSHHHLLPVTTSLPSPPTSPLPHNPPTHSLTHPLTRSRRTQYIYTPISTPSLSRTSGNGRSMMDDRGRGPGGGGVRGLYMFVISRYLIFLYVGVMRDTHFPRRTSIP
jgi:hypothetical protein